MVIGLSVMATQASAITFLSTPGQGYENGLGFVQNYFGAPFALILISAVFLPIYRRLKVYTVYEFLGQRFDTKTRLLGAFALSAAARPRGRNHHLRAGHRAFDRPGLAARADHRLQRRWSSSTRSAGGSDAVSLTQNYQMAVIFAGMFSAFVSLCAKLPAELTLRRCADRCRRVSQTARRSISRSISTNATRFGPGCSAGLFLALSYFGADQSQVQRYISGASLRESRLGLMFNAVCKIPMQFFILLLGVFLFVFYQFQPPPVFFNTVAWQQQRTAVAPATCARSSRHSRRAQRHPRRTAELARRRATRATRPAKPVRSRRRCPAQPRRSDPRADSQDSLHDGRPSSDQRCRLRVHHLRPGRAAARTHRPAPRGVLRGRPAIEGRRTDRARLDDDHRPLSPRLPERSR